jgi:hypothetical protein
MILVLALIDVKIYFSQVRIIKSLKAELRQKDQALEAATWAICNLTRKI